VILLGTDPVLMGAMQRQYLDAAAERHLPAKPSKVVLPTADGMDALGIELCGRDRTLAPRADKLHRLRVDTMALMQRGRCTGRELAALVGRWTWCMLVARPALSCLAAVYRFMKAAGDRLFWLWPSVRTELLLVARVAPLLSACLSSDWYPEVVATDASSTGVGVVVAPLSPELLQEAARECGTASLVASKPAAAAALDAALVARPWSVIVSSAWREPEHINQLELRAVSTAIRHVISRPHAHRRRLLVLCDSMVAVGALAKGRSSSHPLLCRLRPVAALLMASGLTLFTRWIPTGLNPADAASRAASLF
jgi:hypothetical protein